MFWPTVRCGKQGQRLEHHAGRPLVGGHVVDALARSRMSPLVGVSMPASMRSIVVLPEPEGPTMVKNSPSAMSRSIESTAACGPNILRTDLSDRMGCRAVHAE